MQILNSKFFFLNFLVGLVYCSENNKSGRKTFEEEKYGVRYADDCEVCKYVAFELEERLQETGKTSEVIEIGYSMDEEKKKTKYAKSELRLIETLENVCNRLLSYNIHKERTDSTRFSREISQTFQTLHGLVDRGVKVDLGIPYELWNNPSAEITHLKTQCEQLIEKHESDIENWYWNYSNVPLSKYLCIERVLKDKSIQCLNEKLPLKEANKTKNVNTEL